MQQVWVLRLSPSHKGQVRVDWEMQGRRKCDRSINSGWEPSEKQRGSHIMGPETLPIPIIFIYIFIM